VDTKGTNRSRQSLFGAFGALSLPLIHHHYMSINLQLYIHTSTVHLGMQGLVSLLCAQRYATYKSMLDHIAARVLLCKVPVPLSQTANNHLKPPAKRPPVHQMRLVLCV
jgi:hypothetical protein